MSRRLLFIYNAYTGRAKIKNKLVDILDIFVKADYIVTAYPTQKVRDAYDKTKQWSSEYDLLVCSGGDGTLDEVVTAMMESENKIPIGYIPAGTTNDFANSLHIPKDMLVAAGVCVEGEMFSCDIGSFNKDTFVYIAAFGIFADVAYETKQEIKNVLGHMAYILEGMKRLYSIQSYHLQIEYNGEMLEDDYVFGMITNSISVGGFKNMTGKNVLLDDGLFEATFIKLPKNPIELQEIISSLLKEEANSDLIHTFKTDSIQISTSEEIAWTLDGEFGGNHKEVTIHNNKQAIQIMVKK